MMNYKNEYNPMSMYEGKAHRKINPQDVVIPNVETEDDRGNRRVKDIFSTLNDARIIICDGEVNDFMASVVTGQLLQLDAVGEGKDIFMYINSPGGSITAGMEIFDTMMSIKSPVITIGMGMCASMGAFLLSAGNLTGGAKALPNCEIMIHQPLGGYQGQATDFKIYANRMEQMKSHLTAHLAYFCNQNKNSIIGQMETTEEKLARLFDDCERDNFMTAEEALDYGLISEIQLSPKHYKFINDMRELGFIDKNKIQATLKAPVVLENKKEDEEVDTKAVDSEESK